MTDYHDMLTSFMKAKDPTTGKQLDQDRVMLCSMAVLVAGSDTTSSTMRALLMYTMTTAGVMDKLLAEVSMQRGIEWRATSFAHTSLTVRTDRRGFRQWKSVLAPYVRRGHQARILPGLPQRSPQDVACRRLDPGSQGPTWRRCHWRPTLPSWYHRRRFSSPLPSSSC